MLLNMQKQIAMLASKVGGLRLAAGGAPAGPQALPVQSAPPAQSAHPEVHAVAMVQAQEAAAVARHPPGVLAGAGACMPQHPSVSGPSAINNSSAVPGLDGAAMQVAALNSSLNFNPPIPIPAVVPPGFSTSWTRGRGMRRWHRGLLLPSPRWAVVVHGHLHFRGQVQAQPQLRHVRK